MFDNDSSSQISLLENTPLCVIPEEFLQDWKEWLFRPTEFPRPNSVDTASFFCEHNLLLTDPNSAGDMDSLYVITMAEWEILQGLYKTGPVVSIQRPTAEGAHPGFIHGIEVCRDCRTRRCAVTNIPLEGSWLTVLDDRLTDFEEAEIAVRIHAPGEPVPTSTTANGTSKLNVAQYRSANGTITYRKSRRLRNGKSRVQRRRFVIKKGTMVKEIKMMVGSPSSTQL